LFQEGNASGRLSLANWKSYLRGGKKRKERVKGEKKKREEKRENGLTPQREKEILFVAGLK